MDFTSTIIYLEWTLNLTWKEGKASSSRSGTRREMWIKVGQVYRIKPSILLAAAFSIRLWGWRTKEVAQILRLSAPQWKYSFLVALMFIRIITWGRRQGAGVAASLCGGEGMTTTSIHPSTHRATTMGNRFDRKVNCHYSINVCILELNSLEGGSPHLLTTEWHDGIDTTTAAPCLMQICKWWGTFQTHWMFPRKSSSAAKSIIFLWAQIVNWNLFSTRILPAQIEKDGTLADKNGRTK